MVKNKNLVIIIPTYNEEKTILKVYRKVKNLGIPIIIDDCSSDQTTEILKKKKIKYISNKSNMGYEKTIKIGFKYVFKNFPYVKYIATIDADLELPPKYILGLYNQIKKKKIDIIIGSRKKFNRLTESILNIVFKYKFNLIDPISGLKIYKTTVIKNIFRNIADNLFLVDILIIGILKKFKISYKKITTKKRSDESRVGSYIKVNFKILKIALVSLFNDKLNFL